MKNGAEIKVRRRSLRNACAIGVFFALVGPGAVGQANAEIFISSEGWELFGDVFVQGGNGIEVISVNPFGEVAPGPYSYSSSTPSFQYSSADLGVPQVLAISTGLLAGAASSPYQPTATGTTTITVDSPSMTLGVPGLPPLVEINATSLTATTSASGIGPFSTTGSSTLEDLSISGALIGAPISLPGSVTPPANDVLFNNGSMEIIANSQTIFEDSPTASSLITTPLQINFFGTPGSLSGRIDFGLSYAEIATAPEPAAWALMLVGFTGLGAVLRSRRKAMLAA